MKDLYPSRYRTHPSIKRRVDPVVHTKNFKHAPLARDQIESFERDGVLVIENVLSDEEVSALLVEVNAFKRNADRLQSGTVISEPGGDQNHAIRSVFGAHYQSEPIGRLVADHRLAGLARFLLNDDVYVHQSRVNYKPAFCGKDFYWHSDFETWHTEDGMPRMRALSMSVMLTENHPQAGPTMFIPGSQNDYIECVGETPDNHYQSSLRKQEYGVPDHESLTELVDKGGIFAPAPPAGSVVIFDCNTMHGSNSNITPFERVNAFFVFNAWSNRLQKPFGGTKPRPEFIAHRHVESPLPTKRGTNKIAA